MKGDRSHCVLCRLILFRQQDASEWVAVLEGRPVRNDIHHRHCFPLHHCLHCYPSKVTSLLTHNI